MENAAKWMPVKALLAADCSGLSGTTGPARPNFPSQHVAAQLTRALHNTYLLIRHTEAETVKENVFAGDPTSPYGKLGLTTTGIKDARRIGALLADQLLQDSSVTLDRIHILASPLARTQQAASLISEAIYSEWRNYGVSQIEVKTEALVTERLWGNFEGTSQANWNKIYAADLREEAINGVETPAEMINRVSRLFDSLEKNRGQIYLIVTHCDVVQAAQHALLKPAPGTHYSSCVEPSCGEIVKVGLPLRSVEALKPRRQSAKKSS